MNKKEELFETVAKGIVDEHVLTEMFPQQVVQRWRMSALRKYRARGV